jgi:hypothetical protein
MNVQCFLASSTPEEEGNTLLWKPGTKDPQTQHHIQENLNP